ncbi:MAG: EI24 domain-containing protein, partial [Candidatus Riflebacteria bacterium]|nr:EI24 domain-containing protein [Candidatus Riflebacteria bacterium]
MLERSKSTLSRVLDGVRAPMRGADFLLRHPTLTRYAMAPLLLSFVLLVLLLWLTVTTLLVPFHDWLVGLLHLGTWLQWLIELILWPAAIALYLILASFSFTALANLLAGPFNERLSQRTEELATGKAESDVFSVREAFSRLWASMAVQFKKIGFFV